jgi:hypothetical protein
VNKLNLKASRHDLTQRAVYLSTNQLERELSFVTDCSHINRLQIFVKPLVMAADDAAPLCARARPGVSEKIAHYT